jgi:hypothetical protein
MIQLADGEVRSKSHVFLICENWDGTYLHEGRIRRTWNGFKVGSQFADAETLAKNGYSKKKAAELTMKLMRVEESDEDGGIGRGSGYQKMLLNSFYGSMGVPSHMLGGAGKSAPNKNGISYSSAALKKAMANLSNGIGKTSKIMFDSLSTALSHSKTFEITHNPCIEIIDEVSMLKPVDISTIRIPWMEEKIKNVLARTPKEEMFDDIVESYIEKDMKFSWSLISESGLLRIRKRPQILLPNNLSMNYENNYMIMLSRRKLEEAMEVEKSGYHQDSRRNSHIG